MVKAPIIVGGGISGLSAAYYLKQAGVTAVLLERDSRVGGVIRTRTMDGCVIEGGPDSFLAAKPAAVELIAELGLAGELISSNDRQRITYILRSGRLMPMPDGLMMMVPSKLRPLLATRLLSWPAKIRMALEFFRRPPGQPLPDRSVAEFIADHYGTEALDYLAEPLLAGVYGGDPAQLSAASVLTRFVELETKYGSLTRAVLDARRKAAPRHAQIPLFQTLKRGMGALVSAIEERIPPPIHAEAEIVERSGSGYRVRANGEWMETGQVILACPSWRAARLVRTLRPALAQLLEAIPYSSSLTLSLGYRKTDFAEPLRGFGFLVPRRERERLVACTWVGTKFAYRVPDDRVLLRCFFGGESDEAILKETDEAVTAIARHELAGIMNVRAEPVFAEISRWPRSMAQYTVGHRERVKEIEAETASLPGLHLIGNAYQGIGIPDCIRLAKEAASRVAAGE
ncbi:MAG: protoporphyrinogen oxidase [Bryobacteraceae bacterium]